MGILFGMNSIKLSIMKNLLPLPRHIPYDTPVGQTDCISVSVCTTFPGKVLRRYAYKGRFEVLEVLLLDYLYFRRYLVSGIYMLHGTIFFPVGKNLANFFILTVTASDCGKEDN